MRVAFGLAFVAYLLTTGPVVAQMMSDDAGDPSGLSSQFVDDICDEEITVPDAIVRVIPKLTEHPPLVEERLALEEHAPSLHRPPDA